MESSTARFLELVDDVALVARFDGTIVHANAAVARIADPGALRRGRLRDLVHPDDHRRLGETGMRLAAGVEREAVLELRVGGPRRGWRPVLVTAAADPADGLVYAVGRDLTGARRAAARLAEAEDRFRAAFDHAATGMSIVALDGRILRVNAAMCALAGRSAAELTTLTITGLTHPDDRDRTDDAVQALLRGDCRTVMDETRLLRPDGTVVWVLHSASLVREDGAPRYVIGQAVDMTRRRAAEAALRASEERFRALIASAPNGVWAADLDGACTYVNDRLCEITGRPAEALRGFGWLQALTTGTRPEDGARAFRRVLDAGARGHELPIATPGGETRWVRARANPMRAADGRPVGFVGSVEDVTDEVANRRELAARERELRLLTERSGDFLARLAPTLEIRFASPACLPLLGYAPDDLRGRRFDDVVLGEDRPALHEAVERLRDRESATVVGRARRRDGRLVWLESTIAPVRDGGAIAELVVVARDVTERKAAEAQLAHQALHDALTGLPNRTLFLDRLRHALARRVRDARGVLAVLFLDVDRFKVVNDSLGHSVGDRLLVDVAGRLDGALRPADTVARFGGDEFTVLCEGIAGEAEALAIAQRIVDLFHEPFDVDGRDVYLSTSVGVALACSTDPSRPEDLIRDADAAMYRAKERGKARWELFDAAMRDQALRRLELENALRRAVRALGDGATEAPGDELRLHLQPEIAVEGGAVVGFEALVRWAHPEHGLLSPAEFVPLAEETGLIVPIGEWVLRRACTEAAAWDARGLTISVNVSARQLVDPGFVDVVGGILRATGLRPPSLCLELTESAVIESGATTLSTLNGLKRLGVKLAIDDFGTGWSSLGHLRRFPLDAVKLDRSFVSGLDREPQDVSIAAAIISLAHALGLSTVAEGIETDQQLAVLATLGCDLGQGYLFAPPGPLEAFADVLGGAEA
ncbi:MAG: EAL domain-containing protein [Solirubrobacteraceae bacterium]|nr:EAL domain-containing protein [Solirubrobacteraceae bacterium]